MKSKESPHHSFRRTYLEEISDDFAPVSVFTLVAKVFSILKKNWKIFLSIILLCITVIILFVGLMSESSVAEIKSAIEGNSEDLSKNLGTFAKSGLLLLSTVTTGGLSASLGEGQGLILIFIFLIIFLTSTYVARFTLAGKKCSLRDTLFTSMTPLLSIFTILLIILAELIPIFLLIIFTSAAVKTGFLATPFYALLFLGFAAVLIILSLYFLSSSLLALIASTAPGVYPLTAIRSARSLIYGRRLKLIFRILSLFLILGVFTVIIMLPVILLDGALKAQFSFLESIPVVSFFLLLTTCFSFLFSSLYLYLFYREILDHERKEKNE